MGVALFMVLGVLLVFNVILPIYNTSAANNGGAANLTGYTGATAVANSGYLVLVLGALALAAGVVMAFFRSTGGQA